MATPRIAVVTGANRGLGLEFVRQLLARGGRVVAACRRPGQATALTALAAQFPGHLQVLPLDVADDASRGNFAGEFAGLHESLDLLVNNAGVLPRGERFGRLEARSLASALGVNTIAPLMLAQSLAPLLARGHRPLVLNLGSSLGSMTLTERFGTPSYAISKAALNMAGLQLAQALAPQGIGVLTVSPGWVRTDMGGTGAPLTAQESVQEILDLVERRKAGNTGQFLGHRGEPLPW